MSWNISLAFPFDSFSEHVREHGSLHAILRACLYFMYIQKKIETVSSLPWIWYYVWLTLLWAKNMRALMYKLIIVGNSNYRPNDYLR